MENGVCACLDIRPAASPPVQEHASRTSHFRHFSHHFKVNLSRYRCGEPKRASRNLLVRANMRDKEFQNPLSPFQPQSPTGVYLADLLNSNPDLIHTAVEHELEVLTENREAANQVQLISCGADISLYKRIAELKSQERFDALEEILYMLIVQKFVGAQIAMVPSIPTFLAGDMSWPLQFKELESVHSTEALDLILEHSLLVLGKQTATKYFSSSTFAHMSMKSMKEIYVDSVTYGYFMRRLNNRFRLEKVMNSCPQAARSPQEARGRLTPEIAAAMSILRDLRGSSSMLNSAQLKTSEFLAYILSFDAESLKGFRSIRAKESRSIVNKHTEALFKELDFRLSSDGSMRIGGKDEGTQLNFLRSKELVLEAAAFGSFLWDVETYVDSYYSIVYN